MWRAGLMVAVISCALFALAGCAASPTPAGFHIRQINGCANVETSGGSRQDDNTRTCSLGN